MSALRLQPRALRPYLSARYILLQTRTQSTAPTSKIVDETSTPPPPPRPSAARRYRSALIWSSIAILLGLGAGNMALTTFVPPTLPPPGTHSDNVLLDDLNKRIEEEFKVKVLRGKCLGVTKALKGEEGGWVEIIPNTHDIANIDGTPGNGGALMAQLKGFGRLGVERLFWDRSGHQLVAVVWFGGQLSGWPGVVHGGFLATAMTEKIALANALAHESGSSFSKAATPQRLPGTGNHATMPLPDEMPVEPAQTSIDYIKPTYANNFHVIRVTPAYEDKDDVRMPINGHEWIAMLETLDAKVSVKATAKFEPRSSVEKGKEKVVEGAKWSYNEFRQWLWPSRQSQSQLG